MHNNGVFRMIKARLVRGSDQKDLSTHTGYHGEPVLVTTTHAKQHGQFKTSTLPNGTTIVIEASDLEGIVITDLIFSAEKKGATISIQFTDAVNTEVIFLVDVTDKGMAFSHNFGGRFAGWQGCDIKIVCSAAVNGSIAIGYYRTPENKTLPYAAWDAQR